MGVARRRDRSEEVGRLSVTERYPRRGHIYWVEIPDEPERKQRPALVYPPIRVTALPVTSLSYRSPACDTTRRRTCGYALGKVGSHSRRWRSVNR